MGYLGWHHLVGLQIAWSSSDSSGHVIMSSIFNQVKSISGSTSSINSLQVNDLILLELVIPKKKETKELLKEIGQTRSGRHFFPRGTSGICGSA